MVGVPVLFPLQERSQSEGRAKGERRHSGGILHAVCGVLRRPSVIVIPKKAKIRVPLSEEKKWDKVGHDDNNNRDACTTPPWGMKIEFYNYISL